MESGHGESNDSSNPKDRNMNMNMNHRDSRPELSDVGPSNPKSSDAESSNPKLSDTEFSNPKAPEGIRAPKFPNPLPKRRPVDAAESRNLMMTPRAVTASVRAFSSVVMTPHAEGIVTRSAIPRMKSAGTTRVAKGAKESALDRPMFSKEEEYTDRAVERRNLIRQETKRLRDEEKDGWSPIRERENTQDVDRIQLDFDDIRKEREVKQPKVAHDKDGERMPVFKSKMAESIYSIIENRETLSTRIESFVPGRMAYVYEVGQAMPRTVMRSKKEEIPTDPPEFYKQVIQALLPKQTGKKGEIFPGADADVDADADADADGYDDIFPNAGEYVFEASSERTESGEKPIVSDPTISVSRTRSAEKPIVSDPTISRTRSVEKPILFDATTGMTGPRQHPAPRDTTVPVSVRNLITATTDKTKETLDDYDECYPSLATGYDSDIEEEPTKPQSKKEKSHKERQKLDKQVRQVGKILQRGPKNKE